MDTTRISAEKALKQAKKQAILINKLTAAYEGVLHRLMSVETELNELRIVAGLPQKEIPTLQEDSTKDSIVEPTVASTVEPEETIEEAIDNVAAPDTSDADIVEETEEKAEEEIVVAPIPVSEDVIIEPTEPVKTDSVDLDDVSEKTLES